MTQTLNRSDADLKKSVVDALAWAPEVDPTHIGVAVNDGGIQLSGEVSSYPEKLHARKAVLRVAGVTGIADDMTVRSTFAHINDTDIAREASEAIERTVDLPAGAIKATVQNWIITLSGAVPWHFLAESASRAVRYLRGVTNVINTVQIRTVQIRPNVSPTGLQQSIAAALVRSARYDGRHVTVTTDPAGTVTLSGDVHSWSERQQAGLVAWAAPGVSSVVNKIHITT